MSRSFLIGKTPARALIVVALLQLSSIAICPKNAHPQSNRENQIVSAPVGLLNKVFSRAPIAGQMIVKANPTLDQSLLASLKKKNKGKAVTNKQLSAALVKALNVSSVERLPFGMLKVKAKKEKKGYNTKSLTKLKNSGLVEYFQSNYKIYVFGDSNDLFYSLGFQWGLNSAGGFFGKQNVDIDAPEAWEIENGSSNEVVVAVIDTGIDYTHPDLADNMWKNPGEIAGNGVDDDGNGFVDDVYGYDFVNNDGDPKDDMFHGTHCAGIIGAVGGNSRGVSGVVPHVKLMALKILNGKGEGDTANAVKAIDYIIKLRQRGVNVRVMNASFGGGEQLQAFEDALRAANTAGIMFIVAAGNSATDNDKSPVYPANYRLPNLVSVAAIDSSGKLASFSNFGATTVDIAAPGSGILSTVVYGFYFPFDGTSMAAPFVSGVAALVAASQPELTPIDIRTRILNSAKPISTLAGKIVSPGLVSAYHALTNTVGEQIQ